MEKNIKLRLILDVEYTPNATSVPDLMRQLNGVVDYATGNGLLTGETSAEVVTYHASVEKISREPGEHRWAENGGMPRCVTCGCDEDDAYVGGQECTFGTNEEHCANCGSALFQDGECQKCGL